jgi:hypothetical protein
VWSASEPAGGSGLGIECPHTEVICKGSMEQHSAVPVTSEARYVLHHGPTMNGVRNKGRGEIGEIGEIVMSQGRVNQSTSQCEASSPRRRRRRSAGGITCFYCFRQEVQLQNMSRLSSAVVVPRAIGRRLGVSGERETQHRSDVVRPSWRGRKATGGAKGGMQLG